MSTSPLASAIAQLEGFGAGDNIPTQSNNPGDLELGDIGYGTLTASGGNAITVFPDAASGWDALNNQIAKIFNGTSNVYNPNMSVGDFGSTYSGNNPSYGSNLASILGVAPNTPLSQLGGNSSGSGNSILNGAQQLLLGPLSALIPGNNSGLSTLNLARIVVLIVGIILIAAGLFAFKQTQTIIEGGTRAVKKGAELLSA